VSSTDELITVTRKDYGWTLTVKFDSFKYKAEFGCDMPTKFHFVIVVKPNPTDTDWYYADPKGGSIGHESEHLEDPVYKAMSALLLGVET
jgi:hypothetical protein